MLASLRSGHKPRDSVDETMCYCNMKQHSGSPGKIAGSCCQAVLSRHSKQKKRSFAIVELEDSIQYTQASRSKGATHCTPKASASSNSRAVRLAIEFAVATEGIWIFPTEASSVRPWILVETQTHLRQSQSRL